MTELQLYRFINVNGIEHNAHINSYREKDVVLLIEYYHLREWFELIKNDTYFDEGEEVYMYEYYIAINISSYCEYHGIDIMNVISDECKKSFQSI